MGRRAVTFGCNQACGAVEQIGIKLPKCEGILVDESVLVPEHRFSLEDLRETDRWDYDYLTYRGGSTGTVAEG